MALRVSDPLVIRSHAGPYTATVSDDALEVLDGAVLPGAHFIVDATVAKLYAREIARVLVSPSVLVIEASETAKSLEQFPAYVQHLVARSIRRSHTLIAIGGGVIQDITCFLAATLLRGLRWEFYPTTLLAQADSCIGSKSSINVADAKNILGTFTPPARIFIVPHVLRTLAPIDRRSGIGEMLKVHAIAGPEEFERIGRDFDSLLTDERVLAHYIRRSLEIKRELIEIDEFDRGPRNVMNYGHTFGHAIEAATAYAVPHGIAVTIGMDMANFVAAELSLAPPQIFQRMHPTLRANYLGFEHAEVPFTAFLTAIAKDKKNTDAALTLVLPDTDSHLHLVQHPADGRFANACARYFALARAA